MIDLNNLTPEQQLELAQALQVALSTIQPLPQPEYRVYYSSDGKVITYTTEDLPGDYLVITLEDYQQARHDAVIIGGKLIYTHVRRHVTKLVKTKNNTQGFAASKYDISVVAQGSYPDVNHYQVQANEIKR
jgi:pyruvate-formate lyase